MPKIHVNVTKEMLDMLNAEAEQRGVPFASLVREAIAEWAGARGRRLKVRVKWGGPRTKGEHIEDQAPAGAAG